MSQEFSIAKIGGQYIKCFMNDDGVPQFQALTEDEAASHNVDKMLEIGGPSTFNSKLAKTLEEAETEILTTLKANLKENVLALMGFEKDSWGRSKSGWKIDHCNGRMSHASEYIAAQAKAILATFDPNEFLKDPEVIADIREQLKTEFKEQYGRELRRRLRDSMENCAKIEADEIVREMASSENLHGIPQEVVATILGVKFGNQNKKRY